MAYNGSVEVISGLKQKNNADFPIVEASAVYVADGKRLSDVINGLEENNIKTYIDEVQTNQSTELGAYNTRLNSIENHIGTYSHQSSISQRLNAIETNVGSSSKTVDARITEAVNAEKTRATGAETSLANRTTALESNVGSSSKTVDVRINEAVNTEKTRAMGVESGHNTRITSLETNVGSSSKTVDTRITEAVNTEKTRATGAETSLGNRVSTLESSVGSSSKTVDTRITEAVNTEKTRATNAETALGNRTTALEGYVGGKKVTATVEDYIITDIATTGKKVPTAATVKAVTDALATRATALESNVGSGSKTVDVRISEAVNTEKTRATSAETALGNRTTALEGYVGGKNVSATVEGYIVTNIATTGTKVPTAATVKAVTDALGTRTSTLEATVGSSSKTVDVRISEAVNTEKTRATGVEDGHNTRISALENVVGSTDVISDEIMEDINDEIVRASVRESELECRTDDIINEGILNYVKLVDNDGTELSMVKDSDGNVLAYFDEYGDFHITGNLYCANW